jgi:hypothetical protein
MLWHKYIWHMRLAKMNGNLIIVISLVKVEWKARSTKLLICFLKKEVCDELFSITISTCFLVSPVVRLPLNPRMSPG